MCCSGLKTSKELFPGQKKKKKVGRICTSFKKQNTCILIFEDELRWCLIWKAGKAEQCVSWAFKKSLSCSCCHQRGCNSFATSSLSSSVLRSLFSASKAWHGQIIDTIWSIEMFRNTQLRLRQFNAQKAKFFEAEKQRLLKMLLSGCTFSVC